MNEKILDILTGLMIGVLVAICILCVRQHKISEAKPIIQTITTTASTTSTKVAVKSTPVVMTKVNNRGDQKIAPIKVQVTTVKDIKKGEEIPVTITPDSLYESKLGRWKLTVLASYNTEVKFNAGFLYELYHYSNFNFNIGACGTGILANVGYTITPTTEIWFGVNGARITEPAIGIGVRF